MRLFRRRQEPPAEPPAIALASSICGAALGVTRATVERAGASLASPTGWQLYTEYVWLVVHFTDRAAFSRLPQPVLAAFMDELMLTTTQMAVVAYTRHTDANAADLPSPGQLLEVLQERQLEYASYPSLLSTSNKPANQGDTALGAFFHHLPEPWPEDAWAVIEQKTRLSSLLEIIPIERELERVASMP